MRRRFRECVLGLLLIIAAIAIEAAPTCNLGCGSCSGVPLCNAACGISVRAILHPSQSTCGNPAPMGSFGLVGTAYQNTCYSGSGGCAISVPPLRFWEYDRYVNANSGCESASGGWIANSNLDFGFGDPGYWLLYQASWSGARVDGCPLTDRTVAEISFPDQPSEGTVDHFSWYLVGSVNESGGSYDFDRIAGASGCTPATVTIQKVGGVKLKGSLSPCRGSSIPTIAAQNAVDCGFSDVGLTLDPPLPASYTENPTGLPQLIAGFQILYHSGADVSAEPRTSDYCSGVWLPVRDPANPQLALGVVPIGTAEVTVTVPRAAPPSANLHWFATRIVYLDATVNPLLPFDPALANGPWLTSAVSEHCGPASDPLSPPVLAWNETWKDDGIPAGRPVVPGAPMSYTLELTNNGTLDDGRSVVVTDVLPDCLDLTLFDPAVFPGQVLVSPTPANVVWTAASRTLEIRFLSDIGTGVKNTITISGIAAGMIPSNCCNSASLTNSGCLQGFAQFRDPDTGSDPTCTLISTSPDCLPLPQPVTGMRAVKDGAGVDLSWDRATDVWTDSYNGYRVLNGDKALIPRANQAWTGAEVLPVTGCLGVPRALAACTDGGAVPASPALVFYQIRGACGTGLEGTDHPY